MLLRDVVLCFLGGIVVAGCDTAGSPAPDTLRVVASQARDGIAYVAFASPDPAASECAAVVVDHDRGLVVVAGPDDVAARCELDGNGCVSAVDDELASAQACGVSPEIVAEQALSQLDQGLRGADWCPPSEPACDPGGGFGCLSPACKTACAHEVKACRAACGTDNACLAECTAEAGVCFAGCC